MPNRVLSGVAELRLLALPKIKSDRLEKNNFDLLRLLFALTVCLVHAYELSGVQQLKWIAATIGAIALWHAVEKRFLFRNSHYIAAIPVETAEQGLLHAQGTDIQQSVLTMARS